MKAGFYPIGSDSNQNGVSARVCVEHVWVACNVAINKICSPTRRATFCTCAAQTLKCVSAFAYRWWASVALHCNSVFKEEKSYNCQELKVAPASHGICYSQYIYIKRIGFMSVFSTGSFSEFKLSKSYFREFIRIG